MKPGSGPLICCLLEPDKSARSIHVPILGHEVIQCFVSRIKNKTSSLCARASKIMSRTVPSYRIFCVDIGAAPVSKGKKQSSPDSMSVQSDYQVIVCLPQHRNRGVCGIM